MSKTAYTPAAVLKLADSVRKDISFRIGTIADDHGNETNVSPRMLRYSLNDAHAAMGGVNASAIAGAIIYICCAFHNGSQSLAGLTAKPCKPWLAQALRRQFEGLKSGGGVQPPDLERSALALLDVVASQIKPKPEGESKPEAEGESKPSGESNAAHNKRQDAIARKLRDRTNAAQRIRALRAEVRALRAQLAEAAKPKKRSIRQPIAA